MYIIIEHDWLSDCIIRCIPLSCFFFFLFFLFFGFFFFHQLLAVDEISVVISDIIYLHRISYTKTDDCWIRRQEARASTPFRFLPAHSTMITFIYMFSKLFNLHMGARLANLCRSHNNICYRINMYSTWRNVVA